VKARIRHIVAAVDLSERGRPVLVRASSLAAAHGAALSLVHVIDDEYPETLAHTLRAEAEAELARQAKEGAAQARVLSLRGQPHAVIAGHCGEADADLLVIGAQRPDPFWALFRGRMADRLLASVDIPVIVARRAERALPRHLLVAADFSVASRSALAFAAALLPEAKVSFLHVFDLAKSSFVDGPALTRYEAEVRTRADAELDALARDLGLAARVAERIIVRGDPAETILREGRRLEADFLVLGTHGRTGIGRALVGSVAMAVIGGASCDVLVRRAW
jgi:universal stress protein E